MALGDIDSFDPRDSHGMFPNFGPLFQLSDSDGIVAMPQSSEWESKRISLADLQVQGRYEQLLQILPH